jgi:hypothetical protein
MNSLFEKGREGFLDGSLDWDTQTFKVALLDLDGATDVGVKAITSTTNATPVVVTTSAAHGFSNGDIVCIAGVATGTVANNIWKITAASGSVFSLVNVFDGTTNSVGNGVGSGGYVVNLGISASGDNWDDFDGCVIGTPQTITSPTVTGGVAGGAATVTFTAVTGNSVEGLIIYRGHEPRRA